jgi:modulator of FtsH protease
MGVTEKLFGTTTLDERQAVMAKQTYGLLTISVAAAIVGGYIGVTTPALKNFLVTPFGWILSLVLINIVPRLALRAAQQKKPTVALLALAGDGLLSGLALTPLLWFAQWFAPHTITAAAGVTGAVFAAVTGYMMVTRQRFSAPAGLLTGMFVSLMAAITLNYFFNIGFLGVIISIGIGIMGVCMLVYATSDVLNNPDYDSPIQGALMLFAALFNIFVSALNLLLRLTSRD